eukprot:IDg8760t1
MLSNCLLHRSISADVMPIYASRLPEGKGWRSHKAGFAASWNRLESEIVPLELYTDKWLRMTSASPPTIHFDGMMTLLQRDFATPEAGILDLKDPEPFLKMARNFRFDATRPAPTTAQNGMLPPPEGFTMELSEVEKRHPLFRIVGRLF